ncbi:MAG: hypothetical protein KC423_24100, partial [Anaerolineales bacterium]|nr:hypothetical protein [Anaerolineales bacterium]
GRLALAPPIHNLNGQWGRGDATGINAGNTAHLLARLRRPLPALRMAGRDGAANRPSVHPAPIRAIPPPQRAWGGRHMVGAG